MFGRFELTHLRTPRQWSTECRRQLWLGQLHPRADSSEVGLLIDSRKSPPCLATDPEYIDTAGPTFNSYLDMQQAMLKQQGNALYIGPRLDAIVDSVTMRRRTSDVEVLEVKANQAASMFLMNFGVWQRTMTSCSVPTDRQPWRTWRATSGLSPRDESRTLPWSGDCAEAADRHGASSVVRSLLCRSPKGAMGLMSPSGPYLSVFAEMVLPSVASSMVPWSAVR